VSKSYYLLSIEIQRFLLTNRANRTIDCQPFLDKSYNQYTKLFENSRLLKKSIHDTLTDLKEEDKIAGVTITPTQSTTGVGRLNLQTEAITQSVYNSAF
jgi:20S proteasome alpha/beta subunit